MRTVHPLSRTALVYNCLVTMVDATYTAFIVPIGIAFQYDAKEFTWYNAIDIAAGAAPAHHALKYHASISCLAPSQCITSVTAFISLASLARRTALLLVQWR